MKTITRLLVVLAVVGWVGVASASSITYDIFDDFVTATISGTITTDGTTGAIGNVNILDWDLFLHLNRCWLKAVLGIKKMVNAM